MRVCDLTMLPRFSIDGFLPSKPISIPSVFDLPNRRFLPSGRLAILYILKDRPNAAGGSVLLPAYHCPSMVEPVEWAGMRPVFYRINRDLSPDLDDISRKCTADTTAILAAHLFGVPIDLKPLRAFCDSSDIALIEDCAHTPFGPVGGDVVGTVGHYAIASPRKFYPTMDGGFVVKQGTDWPAELRSLGVMYNAKAFWNTIEHNLEGVRLPFPGRIRPKSGWKAKEPATGKTNDHDPVADKSGPGNYVEPQYDPKNVSGRLSLVSGLIIKGMSRSRMIQKRQANYRFLYEELSDTATLAPFFEGNGPCRVPYVLPMFLKGAADLYTRLLRAHVPVWRWDMLRPSDCEVSMEYGRTLIQLPCHQSLTTEALRLLASRIRAVVGHRA